MRHALWLFVAGLVACGGDEPVKIGPDTSGAGGAGTGGSATGGSTGQGGAGANSGAGYESGSRLRVVELVADDGARRPYGFHDSQLDERCSFLVAADGVRRCLPSDRLSVGGYFEDAGCAQPLAISYSSCSPPGYAGTIDAACPVRTTVYVLGSSYTQPMAYVGSPGSCVQAAVPTNATLYVIGSEVPPDTFVAGTEQVE